VGKERSTITNSIRLLRLNPSIQQAIRTGGISAGHGRAIISLENEALQQQLFERIINEKLNVRQAEKAASELKNPKKAPVKTVKELPNHLRKVQKSLADVLDVEVEIKTVAKGKKGKIILDFNNEDELNKILSHFN
jgi:ParB family chromosome partitioning protein